MASIADGTYVLSGSADDNLWYGEAVPRVAGQTVVFTPTITDVSRAIYFGFDVNQISPVGEQSLRIISDTLVPYDGSTAGPVIYVPADATEYSLAVCLLSAGAAYFLDGQLLWRGGSNATATLYVGVSNTNASGTIDSIKASRTLYAPVPVVADTLTSAAVGGTYSSDGGTLTGIEAGGDGVEWTGDTWANTVSGAANTPTLGSELVTNGDMETGDPPTGWDGNTYNLLASEAEERTGGSGSASIRSTRQLGSSYANTSQTITASAGTWLKVSGWLKNGDANWCLLKLTGDRAYEALPVHSSTSWGEYVATGRAKSSGNKVEIVMFASNGQYTLADDISVQVLDTNDLFRSTVDLVSPYAYVSADWIVAANTQAGIVTNLDDAATPANFIIVHHDGTNVRVEKCVAGTYTTLGTTAATYSADAPLVVRTLPSGANLSVWVWYNNAYIANYTVSDAGIVDNTLHGLFSTDADNVCSDVKIYAATGYSIPGAA